MGRVAFVGAGPGAADLITVRGARLLAAADVVLADALADPALRGLAPRARWLDVGKRGYAHAAKQEAINAMLVREAQRHGLVVRLKGGDPSLFGRLEEELQALAAHGIAAEVVPGVTAACAAAAATARPLTRRGRGRSVAFSTSVTASHDVRATRSADSEVFYMGGRQLGALSRRLREAGWPADAPVWVVSRAGCSDQRASEHRVDTLAAAALLHAGRPTVVTVGAAAMAATTSSTTPSATTSPTPVATPAAATTARAAPAALAAPSAPCTPAAAKTATVAGARRRDTGATN